ncbi:MAG: hypothetical protein Q7S88_01750 [Candidatus Daviesbacteria bacterium]|nr:hypothetical protein [Candidatus Daviesbacteria bacterium]
MSSEKINPAKIYDHAGIIDLHPLFKEWPNKWTGDKDRLTSLAMTMVNGEAYFPKNHRGYAYTPRFRPLKKEGFLHSLEKTDYFQRLYGVHQLSQHRRYPALNHQTRADHSLLVADQMASHLHSLATHSPVELLHTLREDFDSLGLAEAKESGDQLLRSAVLLACFMGTYHDVPTIAGGERTKKALRYLDIEADEEELLSHLLFPDQSAEFNKPPFTSNARELHAMLAKHEINPDHLRYAVDCIKGTSNTLLGNLIHSCRPNGDILEADRIAYTLLDYFAAGVFGPDVPRQNVQDITSEETQYQYVHSIRRFGDLLCDPKRMASEKIVPAFAWNTLDLSQDARLINGKVVYSIPEKAIALANARARGFKYHYQGPMMTGLEEEYSREITKWVRQNGLPDCLKTPNLLNLSDSQLLASFQRLPNNRNLRAVIDRMGINSTPNFYHGTWVTDENEARRAWNYLRTSIKPALDTPVLFKGKVIPLKDYMEKVENNPIVEDTKILLQIPEPYLAIRQTRSNQVVVQSSLPI